MLTGLGSRHQARIGVTAKLLGGSHSSGSRRTPRPPVGSRPISSSASRSAAWTRSRRVDRAARERHLAGVGAHVVGALGEQQLAALGALAEQHQHRAGRASPPGGGVNRVRSFAEIASAPRSDRLEPVGDHRSIPRCSSTRSTSSSADSMPPGTTVEVAVRVEEEQVRQSPDRRERAAGGEPGGRARGQRGHGAPSRDCGDERRQALRRPSQPLRAARHAAREDHKHHRPRLGQRQDACVKLHAGLQRPGRRQRAPGRARRRGDAQLTGLRTPTTDGRSHQQGAGGHRRHRDSRGRGRRQWLLARAADGQRHRRRHQRADPARCRQARDTPARVDRRDATPGCAPCWRPTTAAGSTEDARRWSSPRSRRPNTTGAIDSFQRRGRSAVRSEWRLITATHNLMKLHKHQIAAAGAWRGPGGDQPRHQRKRLLDPRSDQPRTTHTFERHRGRRTPGLADARFRREKEERAGGARDDRRGARLAWRAALSDRRSHFTRFRCVGRPDRARSSLTPGQLRVVGELASRPGRRPRLGRG